MGRGRAVLLAALVAVLGLLVGLSLRATTSEPPPPAADPVPVAVEPPEMPPIFATSEPTVDWDEPRSIAMPPWDEPIVEPIPEDPFAAASSEPRERGSFSLVGDVEWPEEEWQVPVAQPVAMERPRPDFEPVSLEEEDARPRPEGPRQGLPRGGGRSGGGGPHGGGPHGGGAHGGGAHGGGAPGAGRGGGGGGCGGGR